MVCYLQMIERLGGPGGHAAAEAEAVVVGGQPQGEHRARLPQGADLEYCPGGVTSLGLQPHVGDGDLEHDAIRLHVPVLGAAVAVVVGGETLGVQVLHDDNVIFSHLRVSLPTQHASYDWILKLVFHCCWCLVCYGPSSCVDVLTLNSN